MWRELVASCVLMGLCAGCCSLDENRKSREAMLQTAEVLEAESAYVQSILDPRALATAPDGTFDQAACIEHANWLEVFKTDNPALARALRAWAEGEEVDVYTLPEVDFASLCVP